VLGWRASRRDGAGWGLRAGMGRSGGAGGRGPTS
jgi:hypothetical protein